MKIKPTDWLLLASLLLLTMSLTGCAAPCAPAEPAPVVVQESRRLVIDPSLLEREKATYSANVRQKLSTWQEKLTGSP